MIGNMYSSHNSYFTPCRDFKLWLSRSVPPISSFREKTKKLYFIRANIFNCNSSRVICNKQWASAGYSDITKEKMCFTCNHLFSFFVHKIRIMDSHVTTLWLQLCLRAKNSKANWNRDSRGVELQKTVL